MVSTTDVKENGLETTTCELPPGKYRLVGFDLDVTGGRMIDEICQIAAYTPTSQFRQYVMPFRNLTVISGSRYLLRVVTFGRYRVLRSEKTGKILKTKSEISAVTDFVQWLENLNAEGGVILITHEENKMVRHFILRVVHKYNLFERFAAVVKGFASTFVLSKQMCAKTLKSYSLLTLSRVLLDKKTQLHSAADRARLCYQVLQQLCPGEEDKGSGDASSSPEADSPAMLEAIRQYASPVAEVDKELSELMEAFKRENNLRPIIEDMYRTRYELDRFHANSFRQSLISANITYQDLEEAWMKDKKESLTALLNDKITTDKPKDMDKLVEFLHHRFNLKNAPKTQQVYIKEEKTTQENAATDESKEKETGDKESKDSSEKSSPGKVASGTSSAKADGGETDVDTSR